MAERMTARKVALRRKARRRRLVAGGAGVVALCLVGGGVALAAGRDTGPTYRTAVASVGSVEQTLDVTGTVASATRYDTAFSVGGTVAGVDVAVGDAVAAGAVLATLDTADLEEAVEKAEATLTDANQQLEDDLDSQTSTTTSTTAATAATEDTSATATTTSAEVATTPRTSTPTTGGPTQPAADPTVEAVATAIAVVQQAQQALLGQYEVAAAALETSRTSVAASTDVCAAFLAATPATDDAETEATPDDTADDTPDSSTDETADETADDTAAALAECQAAIAVVLADQESVDAAQAALLTLSTSLDDAVTAAQTAVTAAQAAAAAAVAAATSSGATSPAATTGATSSGATATSTPTSTGATSSTGAIGDTATAQVASAAAILADRAAITLAEADLAIAQSKLAAVSLTSPVAGTVAAVSIAAGDTVSASSTTSVITVIGTDGFVVTTTVPLAEIDTVELGQSAEITVASTPDVLAGSVSSIGVVNTSTTSTPSYTVVIAVDDTAALLFNGASAQVTVLVSQQDDTLTVPSSAVHVAGSTSTVQVLTDGVAADVEVTTGAVGTELTEIVSGVEAGDEVVLADLSEQLVSTDDTTETGLSGLGETADVPQQRPQFTGQLPGGGQGGPAAG